MPTEQRIPESFQSFGDLLKYLRRRERLTQLELSITVGYSEAQISRLEQNQRLPDLAALKALFIPALRIENEPEMTAHLLELAQSARQEDAPVPGIAPYKGLLFFDQFDADLFFGRESLTARLVSRVIDLNIDVSTRFLAVVGASGSGKSSLMRAGLAVALKRVGWGVHVFTPTADPLKMLDAQFNSNHTKEKLERALIIVDQFEETFTLCRDEAIRSAFIEKLLSLDQDETSKVTVVIALRADFYSHCAQYPLLRQAVAAQQEYIGQMTSEELRRAIEEPAKHGGWNFEPGLVETLLRDIGVNGIQEPEPGALPLLSHALLATWERRRGRTFTLDGYRASGGVRGAIAETAESVFTDQLNQSQQKLARDVFLRLTELGEGTEDTRRRAALNELVRQSDEATQLRAVLNTLAEARLITLNEDSAEVAHEALIREWQRLHEWLTQDREGLHLHRHLTESTHEWEIRSRDAGELYRGVRLAQVQEWASANQEDLNEPERAFLAASLEQEQRNALEIEAQRQRELEAAQKLAEEQKQRVEDQVRVSYQLQRRSVLLTCAFVLAMLAVLIAGVYANYNKALAEQNAIIANTAQVAEVQAVGQAKARATAQAEAQSNFLRAEAQRLATEANALLKSNGSSELIALLSLRSLNLQYSSQGEAALDGAARLSYPGKLFMGHTGAVSNVAFSPDGKYILTNSLDNTARLWDVQSGRELHELSDGPGIKFSPDKVYGLKLDELPDGSVIKFSPDGVYALIAGPISSSFSVWEIKTGVTKRKYINYLDNVVNFATFSQDSRYVITGSGDVISKIDLQSGSIIHAFSLSARTSSVLYISPDGKYALTKTGTGNNKVELWNLDEPVTKLQEFTLDANIHGLPQNVAISPDEKSVLIGYIGGVTILWDAATGKMAQTFKGHSAEVSSVAFSPNGNYVLTGGLDKTARLWDVRTGIELFRMTTSNAVYAVAFSPDGRSVLVGCLDGIVQLWDIHRQIENPSPLFQENYIDVKGVSFSGVAFSPDGKFLATGGTDGLKLWNATTGQLERVFTGSGFIKYGLKYSPDGTYLLSGDWSSGVVSLWNAQTGERLRQFTAPGFTSPSINLNDVAFSLDGKLIIAPGFSGSSPNYGNQVLIWDRQTALLTRMFPESPSGYLMSLVFSPDGKFILTSNTAGQMKLFDSQVGMLLKRFIVTDGLNDATFSPDGKYIATASVDKMAHLWDVETGKEIRQFIGHTDRVHRVAFSPNGMLLASAGADGTARLWNVQTGQEVRRLTGHTFGVENVAFSPDGKYVATVGDDGTARLWDVDYHTTIKYLCSILLRDFTSAERTQFNIIDNTLSCPKP